MPWPTRFRDLSNCRFGRLVVVCLADDKDPRGRPWWLCKCDCGGTTRQAATHLTRGNAKSCGCLRRESWNTAAITHGGCVGEVSPEWRAWHSAKRRCFDAQNPKYPLYGGRGITMCKEWIRDFAAFLAHVGPRPSATHSLDRIDVNGHYEPGNVRWATRREQAGNQRKTVWVDLGLERICLAALAQRMAIRYKSLHKHVRYRGADPIVAAIHLAKRRALDTNGDAGHVVSP